MARLLHVNGVVGGYSPRKPILKHISFEVEAGEMVGLIGLNGAGKSTTMKHILGIMEPQQGEIRIHGKLLRDTPEAYKQSIAFVPESPLLYDELTVKEHLELAAMAYGLERQPSEKRSMELAEQFQMTAKMNVLPQQLSKGMRQKVMIMSALLIRPDLYMIDEPFLGLDPLGIRSLLELLVNMKREGAGILLSSHILSTIEHYCDRFIVLQHGQILVQGPLAAVKEAAGLPQEPLEEAFYKLVTEGERP